MFTHNLDPIIVEFGFITLRWYSLAYIIGILVGWWYGKKIINYNIRNKDSYFNLNNFDDLIAYLVLSIIIGGRLGYILFYNLEYYISDPLEIFKVWKGGMSFHGALIAIIFTTYLFAKRRNIQLFFLLDIIACVSPIGIFLGRITNFINGELVGKTTNVIWSVVFPKVDMLPRHPSQLYEAILEGLILFLVLNFFIFQKKYKTGTCSYLFLIIYGLFRIIAEIFREPDIQVGYFFNYFSMGAILSFFMIIFGFFIFMVFRKNER